MVWWMSRTGRIACCVAAVGLIALPGCGPQESTAPQPPAPTPPVSSPPASAADPQAAPAVPLEQPVVPAAGPAPGPDPAAPPEDAAAEGIAGLEPEPPAVEAAPARRTYRVRTGDTLASIAQAQYGDPSRYRELYEANRDQIRDPDAISPGQLLVVP